MTVRGARSKLVKAVTDGNLRLLLYKYKASHISQRAPRTAKKGERTESQNLVSAPAGHQVNLFTTSIHSLPVTS